MKRNIWLLVFMVPCFAYAQNDWAISQLNNKNSKSVLITAHRCDWRGAPENSVQALKNCIGIGVDIAEFDINKTKDGQLVIMHDKTIDRTTNGKGNTENYTLKELQKFKLKSGTGHITAHTIPTLADMLQTAKGKIIIDIDKGYDYIDEIIPMLTERNMLGQTIFNIYSLPMDSVTTHHHIPEELTLQLIVNPNVKGVEDIIASYKGHPKTIIQITFSDDHNRLLDEVPAFKKNYTIWFNSLWPEQNGGHDDDRAVDQNQPDETWGWLIKKGANILQTDRPKEVLNYLRLNKLHL